MGLGLVLWALFAFQLKHFLADFVLQTKFQVDNKKIYGHIGGFVHAGYHVIGTILVLLVLGTSFKAIAAIAVIEFVLHYHVDWLKGQIDNWTGWTEKDGNYWMVFGADQLVHQLTYLGIVSYLADAL